MENRNFSLDIEAKNVSRQNMLETIRRSTVAIGQGVAQK